MSPLLPSIPKPFSQKPNLHLGEKRFDLFLLKILLHFKPTHPHHLSLHCPKDLLQIMAAGVDGIPARDSPVGVGEGLEGRWGVHDAGVDGRRVEEGQCHGDMLCRCAGKGIEDMAGYWRSRGCHCGGVSRLQGRLEVRR